MDQITVIIKLTYGCNLQCAYCYEGGKSTCDAIEWKTVENTIKKTLNHAKPNSLIKFIWHGGEPLLLGLEFFLKICDVQNKYIKNVRIQNYLQTNGLLLKKPIKK